jgi:pimeloyl-ACP methyl ester carboxylesterase
LEISQWEELGQYKNINGHKVFYIDKGKGSKTLLILHGFPTCSFDFHLVLDELCKKYRVIIHDHIGFGLSDKPNDFSYSLFEQTDIALSLWEKLGVKEAHIFAHDYGTSIATEMVARENEGTLPIKVKSYCLCNGSMLIRMAKLLPIQRLLRSRTFGKWVALLSNKTIFSRNLYKIWYNKSKLHKSEIHKMWKLVEGNHGKAVISKISRYTIERETNWDRWIGGLAKSSNKFHIVWAENDPIAIIAMADELNKICTNSNLIKIQNSGHYPMIETPLEWLKAIFKNPY